MRCMQCDLHCIHLFIVGGDNMNDVKERVIQALMDRPVFIRKAISSPEYRTRCPFCGDSTNENTGHLYLKIDTEDDYPILYNCFKCTESGFLTAEVLSLLDIDDEELKKDITEMNKLSGSYKNRMFFDSKSRYIDFNYRVPKVVKNKKTEYIENRLGTTLSEDDLYDMNVITSLREFLIYNKIREATMGIGMLNELEKNYVGFLSNGSSHILFRRINDGDIRWMKYPITKYSNRNKIFYSIRSTIDVFTKDDVILNLAEGVFDIASVKYNLGYSSDNTINIAVTGKYYKTVILRMIELGIVGSNITINIFSDNDEKFGKPDFSTTLKGYRYTLHSIRNLFKEINVYYNTIGKDFGVPRRMISLRKFVL